uniref:BTB domain-containing protein n=1 Tax=Panagrolaimus superbus TaxID=310955 RepID=A0A914Y955_9BILA
MTKKDNALQKFAHQRYKLFQDQNQQNGRFDVTFQFDKKQLFAHSFVLWPLSEVFESTLFGPLAEKGPITPKRYQFDDFKEFLTYLYIGNCKIDAQNVMSLVDLSEYYQIKPLKNVCDAFITESAAQTENILTLYESLKRYTLKTAMAKVMETIASKTDEILKSKDFLSIEKETILDIVKMDTLNSKEEELFQAVSLRLNKIKKVL